MNPTFLLRHARAIDVTRPSVMCIVAIIGKGWLQAETRVLTTSSVEKSCSIRAKSSAARPLDRKPTSLNLKPYSPKT